MPRRKLVNKNIKRWTLLKIKKALKEISDKGWIKSSRSHNTGIGKTLEDLLGIKENNIALPDFGVMELNPALFFTQKPSFLLSLS